MNNYQLSIKNYQFYKDSGVEWLGDVPEHWEVKKFNHIAYIVEGQINPKEDPYRNYILIAPNHIESGTARLLYQETASEQGAESGKYLFRANDIIYSKIRPALKKVWKANFLGICSADMYPIRLLKEKIDFNYFTFLCLSESFSNFMIATSIRVAMPKVNRNDFHECHFAIPPFSEQKSIADYLDTKTAQCDRKIDLLTQKATQYGKLKQSLINETVTRGLDKSVPMKDSEIEWIGEIPEHWKVKRIKEIFSISRGRVIAQTELIENGYYPVYSSQTKDNGCLGYINTFDYEGDYITWTTDGVNAGTIFLRQGRFNCTNICGTLKLNTKNHFIGYLFYALQVSAKHNKRIDTNGAKIMSNEMMFIKISIPPLSEQNAIADYLDKKTAQIDQIIQTINTQIEKLKELRKTLINDVVTGKIRV